MAAIKYATGTKLLLKFGDGGSPETFAHYCSFTASRSVQLSAEETTDTIPDCDDPDAPAWVVSEITSLRVTATGEGMLNTPDYDALYDWCESTATRNAKLVLDVSAADGGVILSGGFKILNLELKGEKGSKMNVSISISSDGPITKTANT